MSMTKSKKKKPSRSTTAKKTAKKKPAVKKTVKKKAVATKKIVTKKAVKKPKKITKTAKKNSKQKPKATKKAVAKKPQKNLTILDLFNAVHNQHLLEQQNLRNLEHKFHTFNQRLNYEHSGRVKPPRTMHHSRGK